MKKHVKKGITQDRIIIWTGNAILIVFLALILVPVVYILLCSIMDPSVRSSVGVSLDVKDWTLEGYRRVFQDDNIWRGFRNSFIYSISFTAISVFVTLLAAYPMILSRLVDTFISRISLTMLPVPNPHNTACVLSWEEARHWQSRSSGYSSS